MIVNALLFGDPSPSLRWRAAIELEGASDADEDVTAWRAETDASPQVRVAPATRRRPNAVRWLPVISSASSPTSATTAAS